MSQSASNVPPVNALTAALASVPLIGPLKFEMSVYITNGFRVATTKFTLPLGQAPTAEAIAHGRRVALAEAAKKLGGFGWRELNRDEFIDQVMRERT